MKRICMSFVALATISPVFGASVIIDGTHGRSIYVGNFDPEVGFTAELLSGPPTSFTASIYGTTWADPRWCGGFPPGEEPADCDAPIDPIAASDIFTAAWPTPQPKQLVVPFFGVAVNGYLSFGPTDGGRVLITAAGSAVPEAPSWAMMLGGLGVIGGAMRARRKVALSFA